MQKWKCKKHKHRNKPLCCKSAIYRYFFFLGNKTWTVCFITLDPATLSQFSVYGKCQTDSLSVKLPMPAYSRVGVVARRVSRFWATDGSWTRSADMKKVKIAQLSTQQFEHPIISEAPKVFWRGYTTTCCRRTWSEAPGTIQSPRWLWNVWNFQTEAVQKKKSTS